MKLKTIIIIIILMLIASFCFYYLLRIKKHSKNNKNNLYIYCLLAMLIALSAVLSYFDGYICGILPQSVIHFKLGIANIAIMLIIYNYKFSYGLLSVILKSLFVGLLLGTTGIITFLIGFSGSILSFLMMYMIKKFTGNNRNMILVGIVGGFFHPVGQLICATIIYGYKDVLIANAIIAPVMILLGSISGVIIGVCSKRLNLLLTNLINYKDIRSQ